ncbi:Uu.00g063120.m01.CDS01 [Anthostomella pinea]|uniref:tRNA wybutosine-synthesizing protein 4 n=1 Tax=Anthostomella pinea TaxID=933095 RepID=A0AAI8VTA7_9PEZI|nr:Uu.00g063120.m01.CDS01 [Anthostomella pinea]
MAVVPDVEPGQVPPRSTKQRAQDDQVMATNSSSIVSKRSVERIYYPDEAHFFRHFVKKFQRRAPLINRGYHLRLHIIDVAVRRFLEHPSEKSKVIVNLGCGSDVLPWQCMTRYPQLSRDVKFVDIDFPDLMKRKRTIIEDTPELNSLLTGLRDDVANKNVLLQSDQYFQVGCDLRDLAGIQKAMLTFLDTPACTFMFVAEVSITYMETEGADSVIRWASTLGQAEFCLLEQILPDGPDHPFANTMLSHFDKLKTPLKSVFTYPTLEAQRHRFTRLGWEQLDVQNLWQIWASDKWLSPDKRRELDTIETFDEWEEFALFAGHYCLVIARNVPVETGTDNVNTASLTEGQAPVLFPETSFSEYSRTRGQRRFASAIKMRNHLGELCFANAFGLGTNSRLRSCDLYSSESTIPDVGMQMAGPNSRMCHAVVNLGFFGSLLTGGRASPTTALRDCWHFSTEANTWSRVHNLPLPLYRHSVAQLGNSNMVLLVGGKSDSSTIFGGCLLYQPGSGWRECRVSGSEYNPVFGAMLVSFKENYLDADGEPSITNTVRFHGVLAGGLLQDGTVAQQVLRWSLLLAKDECPTVSFERLSSPEPDLEKQRSDTTWGQSLSLISRFGASALLHDSRSIVVVGGIIRDGILSRNHEILLLEVSGLELKVVATCCLADSRAQSTKPRPLLVGTSAAMTDNAQLVLMGGGATCFSMGTYWNQGCYSFDCDLQSLVTGRVPLPPPMSQWKFGRTVEIAEMSKAQHLSGSQGSPERATNTKIPRLRIAMSAEFVEVVKAGKPVVIEGCPLGTCVDKWTTQYLKDQVGYDRKVVVHEAGSSTMDFNAKNFAYVTKAFGPFMSEVAGGGKLYLRALSEDRPTAQPACLASDFPQLADDFQLPEELSFVTNNAFSSVLRISGPVTMWLHYDVMANIYCQVSGSKRFVLYPPSDVDKLTFAPGASSSSVDVFSELESPRLASTHPHEAVLGPGDILFLPPVWLHTAAPLTDLGVAVNVFFRSLESGYSPGRDVYGNRDVMAYEKSRQDIARIASSFSKIPPDMREFYIRQLVGELAQKITD